MRGLVLKFLRSDRDVQPIPFAHEVDGEVAASARGGGGGRFRIERFGHGPILTHGRRHVPFQ